MIARYFLRVLCIYKYYLISFPDFRRNQVESLSSVILYFQSSFNCRVVNLYFERMNTVVTAFSFDFFFFLTQNSEKELELSVAVSGARDPEKKVRNLDILPSI